MLNRSQSSNFPMDQAQCILCHPNIQTRIEIGILMKEILEKLKQIFQKRSIKFKLTHKQNSFYQLMKCIYSEIQGVTIKSFQCQHQELKDLFCKSLNCNQIELLECSQALYLDYSKRNYELEVIKSLMLNVPKTIQSMIEAKHSAEIIISRSAQIKIEDQSRQINLIKQEEQYNNIQGISNPLSYQYLHYPYPFLYPSFS